MRLISPGDTAPASVNRYLLPHEHQVITVRKHPAVLIVPIVLTLAGLIVAGVLSTSVASDSSLGLEVIWWAWAALLLYLIWRVINWSVDYFVVTSRRILQTSGILTRKVAMMPLSKVTDMSFQRSATGRMFGYGQFIVESAGQDQAMRSVDHIPYPEQLYLEVIGLIFPAREEQDLEESED
jgi:uncharacterized membrane protein YdbT with pleckstrin-like domain